MSKFDSPALVQGPLVDPSRSPNKRKPNVSPSKLETGTVSPVQQQQAGIELQGNAGYKRPVMRLLGAVALVCIGLLIGIYVGTSLAESRPEANDSEENMHMHGAVDSEDLHRRLQDASCLMWQTERTGTTVGTTTRSQPELCQPDCQARANCFWFVWYAETTQCVLKGANPTPGKAAFYYKKPTDPVVVTGPKVCPSTTTAPAGSVPSTTTTTTKTTVATQQQQQQQGGQVTITPTTFQNYAMGNWQQQKLANIAAAHAILVPGRNSLLLVERPTNPHPNAGTEIAGEYLLDNADPNSPGSNYKPIAGVTDAVFCSGHYATIDGELILFGGNPFINKCLQGQCGGYRSGLDAIRIFGRNLTKFAYSGTMAYPRFYPTVITLADGRAMVVGGSTTVDGMSGFKVNANFELFSRTKLGNKLEVKFLPNDFVSRQRGFWYPHMFLLPSGHALIFGDQDGIIVDPNTGNRLAATPPLPSTFNGAKYQRTYPNHGPGRLLPIVFPPTLNEGNTGMPVNTVEFVIFGGSGVARGYAIRLAVTMRADANQQGGYAYSWGQWQIETMPGTRNQHMVVNLPTGKWIHLNGGKTGSQGDANVAITPELKAWEYNPDLATGRYKVLAASQIIRLYHNAACLLPDGRVGSFGSDRNDVSRLSLGGLQEGRDFTRSPWGNPEFRVDFFSHQDWYRVKPVIAEVGLREWTYAKRYRINFAYSGAATKVSRVTLHAPCHATHGSDFNQRTLVLAIKGQTKTSVDVLAPPNSAYAPYGFYLLFVVMDDNSYSTGKWVRLTPPGMPPIN